jgi:hypothetical protein
MPLLTLFTAPKPFTNPHIDIIQRNAILSWKNLPDVDVILMGHEPGMEAVAAEYGVRYLPEVTYSEFGTPLLSSMFQWACQVSDSPLMMVTNADVIYLPNLVTTARQVMEKSPRFLMLGQRWDMEITQLLDFSPGWVERLQGGIASGEAGPYQAIRHPPLGSDYFIYPRDCFTDLPNFAIGRSGWDNWMIYRARILHWPAIDASDAITVIHQNHDYSHLPGNRPPYRLPETLKNIRLAGGRRTILLLTDTDHQIFNGQVRRLPVRGKKLLREIELFPLLKLHSNTLAEVFYIIYHPRKAWKEWRGRIASKLGWPKGSDAPSSPKKTAIDDTDHRSDHGVGS